jgi:hypothetical protein
MVKTMPKNGKSKYNPAWYSEDLDDEDDLDVEGASSSNGYLGTVAADGLLNGSRSTGAYDLGDSLRSSSTYAGSTSPRLVIGIDYGTTYTGIIFFILPRV